MAKTAFHVFVKSFVSSCHIRTTPHLHLIDLLQYVLIHTSRMALRLILSVVWLVSPAEMSLHLLVGMRWDVVHAKISTIAHSPTGVAALKSCWHCYRPAHTSDFDLMWLKRSCSMIQCCEYKSASNDLCSPTVTPPHTPTSITPLPTAVLNLTGSSSLISVCDAAKLWDVDH